MGSCRLIVKSLCAVSVCSVWLVCCRYAAQASVIVLWIIFGRQFSGGR